jgi:hypothetical protein
VTALSAGLHWQLWRKGRRLSCHAATDAMPQSLDQRQPTEQRRPSNRRRRRLNLRGKRRKKWAAEQEPIVDRFRAQHLVLMQRQFMTEDGRTNVVVDETESPLSWLASRRGRDGRALEAHQLEAGERLRADFTRANLMPRITSDWSNPSSAGRRAQGRRTGGPSDRYDSCLATARTSGAGCRRSRIRGVIGRRLLLS